MKGMRAISHNAYNHERQESEIEKQNSNMNINFSNLLRKQSLKSFYKNSSILTGKSFGSKAVSRKVSPKTSNLVSKENSIERRSESKDSNNCEKRKHPRDIIIESLNSYSSRSSLRNDIYSDMNKYLNTYNSNQDYKLTYGSEYSNFNPIVPIQTEVHEDEESTLDAPNYQNYNFRATNFLKRNSTVKEIRKQKLIGTKNKVTHEPQSVADEAFVRIHKKRRHRNKNRAKKFRQLSRGNQVLYKGPRGFELIKKYRHRRRNESCQYRQSSLNPSGFYGSVRSRNKSSEGFLSSARSCSSGCNSAKRSNNANLIRNKQPGFFTRNKLNAKYRAISEAKKMRLQKTLNKIMKIHANHADVDHLSPKSSTALCESINQSSNIKEPCKCGLISSGTVSHQRSTERNLNFDTPKVSICDHDYVQLSRNYEQTKKFYNFSNKTSQYSLLKVGEGKNYVFNSHGKVSPKSISNSSHRKIGTRTQKPSFVESSNDINLCNVRHYPNKRQISDVVPLQPVMEAGLIIPKDERFFKLGEDSCSPQRSICKESKRMKSGVTVTHHTASSSLNKEYVLTFDSNDVPLSTNPS